MCGVVGYLVASILNYKTAWVCAVLSRSIQFPRELINILLTSCLGPYCKLRHLVFSTLIHGPNASHLIHTLKWKNMVSNLQYSPQSPLARGIYPTVVKTTTRPDGHIWRLKEEPPAFWPLSSWHLHACSIWLGNT